MSKDGDDDLSKRVSRDSLKRNKSTGSSGNVRFSEPLNDYAELENRYEDILGPNTEDHSTVGMAEELASVEMDVNTPAATLSMAGTVSQTMSERMDHEVSSVVENILTGLTPPVEETEKPDAAVSSEVEVKNHVSTDVIFEDQSIKDSHGAAFHDRPSKDSTLVNFEDQTTNTSVVGFHDRPSKDSTLVNLEDQTTNTSVVGFNNDRSSKDSTLVNFEDQTRNTSGVGFNNDRSSKDSTLVNFEDQTRNTSGVGFNNDRSSKDSTLVNFEDHTRNTSGVGFSDDRSGKDSNQVSFDNHQASKRNLNSYDVEEQPMYKEAETNPNIPHTAESFDGPTPEDIFDEIKVAHLEKAEMEGAQNLHSFVISKTYSSENVVVLLNLRRLKDGEWVLDKTIAQGLKSQTYGGLVSIDEYGFSTVPSTIQPSTAQPSTIQPNIQQPTTHQATSIHPPMNAATSTAEIEPPTVNDEANYVGGEIMEVLRNMDDCVASLNRQIKVAHKLAKNPPVCPEIHLPSEPEPESPKTFDELPITDQLMKMFAFLVSQDNEVLNLCDNSEVCSSFDGNTQTAITSWLRSLIETVSSLCGWKIPLLWLLPSLNGNLASATATQLLAQSRAILEQASQSGVVIQLAAKSSKFFNSLPSPMSSSRVEIAVEAKDEQINLVSVSGNLEINTAASHQD